MGRKSDKRARARAASFQLEEPAEDPRERMQAFRARMFDLKPDESAAFAAPASSAGDAIPAVQWKASKRRKKQRLADASVEEEEDVVPVIKVASGAGMKKDKKKKKKTESVVSERSNVVRTPGQRPAVVVHPGQSTATTKKKQKKKIQNGGHVVEDKAAENGVHSVAKPKAAANVPAAKPFEEDADPLGDVMKRVMEKMEAERSKQAKKKKTLFAAFTSAPRENSTAPDNMTKKQKKKAKKRKASVDLPSPVEAVASIAIASGESNGGDETSVKATAELPAKVQHGSKTPPTANTHQEATVGVAKVENTSVLDAARSPETALVATASAPSVLRSPKQIKKKIKRNLAKQLNQQKLQLDSELAEPVTPATRIPNGSADINTSSIKVEVSVANGDVTAGPTVDEDAKASVTKGHDPQPKKQQQPQSSAKVHLNNSPKKVKKKRTPKDPQAPVPENSAQQQKEEQDQPTSRVLPSSPYKKQKTAVTENTVQQQKEEQDQPTSRVLPRSPYNKQKTAVSDNTVQLQKEKQAQPTRQVIPSSPHKKQKTAAAAPVSDRIAAKSLKKPAKPVGTLPTPKSVQACRSIPSAKRETGPISNFSDDSDSDSDRARPGRAKQTNGTLKESDWSDAEDLSEDDAGSEPNSEDEDEDENAVRAEPHIQRQFFSALIDEAAREHWELPEVGRLVRLFSALGWARQSNETAKFLRHYCAELVSADFLDGLGVTMKSNQLLDIFERGSGSPQVFVNKVASAIENHYLCAKDPAVAAALERQIEALADPSTRGICEFLLPLLESLSTVRDFGAIASHLCRHWQPERAASLVQQVLLMNVFDDLEGDQDEVLEFLPQLKGMLDFPSRMAHEDADEDGNLIGLIASEDEGDDKHSGGSGDEDDDDPEAALGEILSDEEDEDEEEDEYEGETDSEEEREAAIRYGPDRRQRRRSQFILDEADESEGEEEDDDDADGESDEHGWKELAGSDSDA